MKKELPIMIFHKDNQDYYVRIQLGRGERHHYDPDVIGFLMNGQDVQDVQVSVLQIWPVSMNIS